jgi:Trk-type K+ transport system membrane component
MAGSADHYLRWFGAFNAISAFNNSGMSLLDANMVPFQTSIYMLLTMGGLILAGNTCYPIILRLIIWTLLKLMPAGERWEADRQTLEFLLRHPRRCYTNLFPARHTWWLLCSVICLNGIDWAAFEVLNVSFDNLVGKELVLTTSQIGNGAITDLPGGFEVIDGLFQAFAVRSGGFYVVPISTVRISLQILYVVMMYISVYPVVITMRNSNVYEERSLGIYADDSEFNSDSVTSTTEESNGNFFGRVGNQFARTVGSAAAGLGFGGYGGTGTSGASGETRTRFVQQQFRAQLAHDIWWIVLAVFLIMIVEGSQFDRDPATFSVFNGNPSR